MKDILSKLVECLMMSYLCYIVADDVMSDVMPFGLFLEVGLVTYDDQC